MDSDATTYDWSASSQKKFTDLPALQTDDNGVRRHARPMNQRTRAAQINEQQSQDVAPLANLNAWAQHPPLKKSQSSKASLFHLFSKPKAEKAHGYAEQGLAVPPPLLTKTANASSPALVVQVPPSHAPTNAASEAPPRAPSSMSFRSTTPKPAPKSAPKSKVKLAPPPAPPRERKGGPWDAPPLFQAYPQSVRYGVLEVSPMAAGTVLQKSKSKLAGGLQVPADHTLREDTEDRGSIETRRTAKTTMKHMASGSFTHPDLPRKMFVLVTSGYLLQYAESGSSNRLPEKILQLGKDSAAFACDLVPGKHHVLQVSQAVDEHGVVVANSSSIFSKLGLRTPAAKRMTSSFLLVMPGPEDMDSWMIAIRAEIETLGGNKARPDTAVRPKTGDAATKLNDSQRTANQSHRYQVKRDPSKVPVLISSVEEAHDLLPATLQATDNDGDKAETAAIDGCEQEVEPVTNESATPGTAGQGHSDDHSADSSAATSIDQQRLNSLRNSQRTSHGSIARTIATTVDTSRANSVTSSPPSDTPLKETAEVLKEVVRARSPYRTLASYNTGSKRRSAMPVSAREPLPHIDVSAQVQQQSAHAARFADSPVTGHHSALPVPSVSPKKLGVATSEPNLRAAADTKAKHDSKMPTPPIGLAEEERPQSFLADLPSPSMWVNSRPPNKRTSTGPPPPPPASSATSPRSVQRVSITAEPLRLRRHSSQPFTLPLRINPSTPANRPPSRNGNRNSLIINEDEVSPTPIVHTLTAKVDPPNRSPPPPGSPQPDFPIRSPARTSPGRLSLFPSQMPAAPAVPHIDPVKQSPKSALHSNLAEAQAQAHAHANGPSLRRPTSLQVRADHAPFLSSVRHSSITCPAGQQHAVTAPIRSLKPSRSSSQIQSLRRPSPTDRSWRPTSTIGTPAISEEASDKPTPLLDRTAASSPLPGRTPSRASGMRKLKPRTSLPELDLGIPVVGLGPPAPPPQSPLPLPPMAARPISPLPPPTGLGIQV